MGAEDWELHEGIPRWVWKLDEQLARLARKDAVLEIPERVEHVRRQRFPDWSQRMFQGWIMPKLEHCRRRRNAELEGGGIRIVH